MKNFLILIIVFFFSYQISFANEKIAFVDVELIINESEIGKKLNKKLEQDLKNENKKLITEEKILKEKENDIINQQNILSKDELNNKITDLRKEIDTFQKKRLKINDSFRDLKLKQTNYLVSNLNNILSNYAEKNSISLIVQKKYIVVGKTELDITKDILQIFNSEVKSIKN